jgi:hypothetical protein
MAFSKGRDMNEVNNVYKRYTGIVNFKVLGVNPDLQTLNSWGIMVEKEPEYLGTMTGSATGKEHKVAYCRFYVKSVDFPDFITSIRFTVHDAYYYKKDKSGIRIIDKYGNSTWASQEEFKSKRIPKTRNGSNQKIDADYRPAKRGESELIEFLKNLICVPDSHRYVNESWEKRDDADNDAKCGLDDISLLFKGDFHELAEAVELQPGNEVKLLCGVRTADDGRVYQEIYSYKTLSGNSNKASEQYQKEIDRLNSNTTEYSFGQLKEWQVRTATTEEIDKAVEEAAPEADNDLNDLPFED